MRVDARFDSWLWPWLGLLLVWSNLGIGVLGHYITPHYTTCQIEYENIAGMLQAMSGPTRSVSHRGVLWL
jgi:hypothetical protein